MSYRIYTDATADMSSEVLRGLPKVEVIPMEVRVNDHVYQYGPQGNLTVTEFYDFQRNGSFASTTQINPETYSTWFEKALDRGENVIYLGFSSGMSGCMQSARIAAEELSDKYPERKILCIDTLCASVGEGFLVQEAARKQAEGLTLEELKAWVMENRLKVCHWFTVDVFDHLKHGGRVSAATAAMGTMLNIKPMLHVDENGRLEVTEKTRGQKKAMAGQIRHMAEGWDQSYGNRVLIGHGDDLEKANMLQHMLLDNFPDVEVSMAPIGPVIGAHTGPGMLALIYWGNNR